MADYLLTTDASSKHPLVKHCFDKFRVVTDVSEATNLHEQAIQHECRILSDSKLYHENGLHEEVDYTESIDALTHFLLEWRQLMEHRKIEIENRAIKLSINMKLDAETEIAMVSEKKRAETKIITL